MNSESVLQATIESSHVEYKENLILVFEGK